MFCRFTHWLAAAGIIAALLLADSTSALAQNGGGKPKAAAYPYKFTDLGQLGYSNRSGGAKAYGINEPDEDGVLLIVGGGSNSTSPNFATVWEATAGGALLNAAPLPDSVRGDVAVNDAGITSYWRRNPDHVNPAGMLYIPDVGPVELPWWFTPTALNNVNQVAGYDVARAGMLFNIEEDGSLSGWLRIKDFVPHAVNDWGLMAGKHGNSAAIAWLEDGELQVEDLPFSGNLARATGVNNFGAVVGVSGARTPFLWRPGEGAVSLTTESGAALDINDHGQVVGWAYGANGYYAFLWQNGRLFDLNTLNGASSKSFRLGSADTINNAGHIAGKSESYKGTNISGTGSYLLTPNR